MAKNTKALSGPAKRKYFRDALHADAGVSADAAKRLAEKFDADVSQMRVRHHAGLKAAALSTAPSTQVATEKPAPSPPAKPAMSEMPAAATFDPHAFSLIVVMTKQGETGLRARLDTIADAEHLKALARAQHVAIDTSLESPAQLRAAIIEGTARRIADRRAAAS